MANEIIKNGIIGALESLIEMAANVTATKGPIHQLDIDLLKDQIKKLYHEVQMLDEANTIEMNSRMQIKSIPHVEPVAPPVTEEVTKINIPVKEKDEVSEAETKEIISDPVPAPEFLQVEEIRLPEPDPKPTPVINHPPAPEINKGNDLFSQPVTVADKFTKEDNSINQQLMGNHQMRNQKLNEIRVLNLRTAIGINDKFMFVNELFKGEMKEFDSVINMINEARDEQMAHSILMQNLQKQGTADKTDARNKLERFIQRRFL